MSDDAGSPVDVVDEAAAWAVLEQLRWGGAPTSCPRCDRAARCRLLRPAAADGRRTRTGAVTVRRVWKCGACRRQFSVLSGTVLAGTRISVMTWLQLIADVADHRCDGVTVAARRYGVTAETARRMTARLERCLAAEPRLARLLGGG